MSLAFIGKDSRVSWRDVLIVVASRESVTSKEVAEALHLSHPDACIRLRRLKEWGMVRSEGGARNRRFSATDYGMRIAAHPVRQEHVSGHDAYLDLGEVIEGPVALMRIVEVDYQDFEREEIRALPSRVGLSPEQLSCEAKYDGWLSQTAGGRLYSRRGKEITEKFAPISRIIREFDREHMIGELVYWDRSTGKMNEPDVTRVAGTEDPEEASRKMLELEKKGFFQIVYFDIIGYRGRDISKRPFEERREILEKLVNTVDDRSERITLSPAYPVERWRDVFKAALDMGGEGVVIKNLRAPYFWNPLGQKELRPSGVQWKVKATRSDDFVVFDWKRSQKNKVIIRFGQFCRGELVEVGEVNNLSKEEEEEMIRLLEKGPFVAEIGFQERFPKFPGRLRNPVFLRIRLEKPIESATMPDEFC